MVWNWVIQLIIAVAFSVASYLLTPKPKTPKPTRASDLESPTASAGRPCMVLFGTMTIKGGNILDYRDKSRRDYTVKAET